jgi:hypothetical protein
MNLANVQTSFKGKKKIDPGRKKRQEEFLIMNRTNV